MRVLVTGGAGFIGSHYVRKVLGGAYDTMADAEVVVLDKLTYAGSESNLESVRDNPRLRFVRGDICDGDIVREVMAGVDLVVHFAAESHVDRSILGAADFVMTNVVGTQTLLQAAVDAGAGKFVHVSTDEVYGSIAEGSWTEEHLLEPNSPYSASKAGADLMARSYSRTHGLPVCVTRCSNNYGPHQFPEKVVPLFVTNLMDGKKVPLYGDGLNVRDWLHVDDHCWGIQLVADSGRPGEIYNIGGGTELTNVELTQRLLDAFGVDWSIVERVTDRKAHDRRYSVDITKISDRAGLPAAGVLRRRPGETVAWYRDNRAWWEPLKVRAKLPGTEWPRTPGHRARGQLGTDLVARAPAGARCAARLRRAGHHRPGRGRRGGGAARRTATGPGGGQRGRVHGGRRGGDRRRPGVRGQRRRAARARGGVRGARRAADPRVHRLRLPRRRGQAVRDRRPGRGRCTADQAGRRAGRARLRRAGLGGAHRVGVRRHGANFVKTMARCRDAGRRCPSWTTSGARRPGPGTSPPACWSWPRRAADGHRRCCTHDGGDTTWFGFARAVFDELGADPARVPGDDGGPPAAGRAAGVLGAVGRGVARGRAHPAAAVARRADGSVRRRRRRLPRLTAPGLAGRDIWTRAKAGPKQNHFPFIIGHFPFFLEGVEVSKESHAIPQRNDQMKIDK